MKKNTLEVDSVHKQFNYKKILSDVYLKCETAEIIGVLGRNVCGKSTLLKIIFGIEPAEQKFIRINGAVKNKTSDLLKDLSYLDQNPFIPNHLSVKKAISLSIYKDKLEEFYNDDMIQQIKNSFIYQLSGGELRYLEIKLILFNESKFVLLDEPYNGISPLMIEKINTIILYNASKKGIIITDHNYSEILKIATKIILIKNGKTIPIKDKTQLKHYGYLTDNQ